MTEPPETAGFRRVLVALDSAASSSATLELAAGFAAASACELSGLFVEDLDLLRLAELPFAREVQITKAMTRALGTEQLLQDLRAQAALARTALVRQAERYRIAWSFHVTQGRSDEALLLAAVQGDIIAMARGFGPLGQSGRLSERIRLIAARAPGPLLLAGPQRSKRPGRVLMPYDASPAAEDLLAMAAGLARARGETLEVMLLGEARDQGEKVEARIRSITAAAPLPGLQLWAPRDRVAARRRLLEADSGLLVLPADAPCFAPGEAEEIIERAQLPVIVQSDKAVTRL